MRQHAERHGNGRAGKGTLYVVATPIGNLEDLSPRAARTLAEADLIAAEDTRRVAKLLRARGIDRPTTSFHSYSGEEKLSAIAARLAAGQKVALVSDAGTPCISDPGAELVAAAWEIGARVVPVPGPCAAVVALAASGFAAGRFFFAGYPPRKGAERRRLIEAAASAPWPSVFYEAPGRAQRLLRDVAEVAGAERMVVVARELTKMHEEIVRGPVGEVVERLREGEVRGEVTVVMEGSPGPEQQRGKIEAAELARWLAGEGLPPGRIAAGLVRLCGMERGEAYEMARRASSAARGDEE